MSAVRLLTQQGEQVGEVRLDAAVFDIEPNVGVMHQVVNAQLAARRAGTHSTKGRSEVAGGGAKPWRQKGTGRARHGSIRSPQWRGGGAAHGPKPRDYRQRTPKKMKRLALISALSDRAKSDQVIVVDRWSFETPRTRDAVAALSAIGAQGKVLVVLGDEDANAYKSFRNLTSVHCLHVGELNTYDVLNCDVVVFTADTLVGDAVEGQSVDVVEDAVEGESVDVVEDAGEVSDAEESVDVVDDAGEVAADTPESVDVVEDDAEVAADADVTDGEERGDA